MTVPARPPATRLGDMPVTRFLQRHWQRSPLVTRQALPGLLEGGSGRDASPGDGSQAGAGSQPPFGVREVLALARDADVESRLVIAPTTGTGWQLRQGPFARLPARSRPGWTVLVQGVDLHLPAGRALMDRFRFLPDARLDDLMVSYASDGGGVGPHVDSYDVFLLQVHGRRRWRLAPPGPWRLVPEVPLRLVDGFVATEEWLLEPGDMLYLPPGWVHEGTAVGECMTCSIGFRAPSAAELRQAFFAYLADHGGGAAAGDVASPRRYRDRTRRAASRPAAIPDDMATTLRGWLEGWRPPASLLEEFIGCHLTEPKPSVWFEPPARAELRPERGDCIALAAKSRMLYRGRRIFLNGEVVALPADGRPEALRLLRALADQRGLDAVRSARALRHPWLRATLLAWLAAGWIEARPATASTSAARTKDRDASA